MTPNRTIGQQFLDALGSYWLACILLVCLFVLTIFGTLYQVDHGLYAAKQRFFLSWMIWWNPTGNVQVPVFPGGITSMLLLAINLVVGGFLRLRLDVRVPTVYLRRLGVLIVHIGIVFLLLAGLVKTYVATEGHLRLYEGQQANFFQNERLWEVAVWEIEEPSRMNPPSFEGELVIEHGFFADLRGERERTFKSPLLPFDLVLSHYLPNSRVMPKGPMWEASGPTVDGYAMQDLGPAAEGFRDIAGMHVEARTENGSQRGILWGLEELPWAVDVGDRHWAVAVRPARYPMPFTLRLEDFQKEDHPGMGMAKAFRSYVTKMEDEIEERILIQMNEPLRHGGLVFFQSSWGPERARPGTRLFSVFSVVDNPSDKWPEVALWIITQGLILAFGARLFVFLRWVFRHMTSEQGDMQ